MTKIRTTSGKLIDLLDPDPDLIEIEDIAIALARICRFGGHGSNYYSVAEHCIMMNSMIVSPNDSLSLAILMHDAAEAYLGDVVTPLKKELSEFYEYEKNMEFAIFGKFGVQIEEHKDFIRALDVTMLKAEKIALFGNADDLAEMEPIPRVSLQFQFMLPDEAAAAFLNHPSIAKLKNVQS